MRLILSLLMLGIGASTWAQALSSQQALQRALNSQQAVSSSARMKAATMQPQYELTLIDDAAEPAYYVFTPISGQGYLVVSGDEAAAPVLGYSDNGILDPDNLPESMVSWLTQYAEQIEWARANGVIFKAAPSTIDNRAPIAPLCTTKWNQGAPFNDLCPRWNGEDYNCVTGCVATAMSQVMKYHNYPKSASISADYTYSDKTVSDNVNYTFDWDNMLDDYYTDEGYTEEQGLAVAQLLYAVGLSVEMMYTPSSSGALSSNIPLSLVNNYGYDQNAFQAYQKYHSAEEWEQLVYDQLRYVGPVEYSGQSLSGGHSFVCDGYDKNGYFHINWGWGGMSNGYFLLSCLDPSSQGIGGSSSGYVYENALSGGLQLPDGSYIYKEVSASECTLTPGTYAYADYMPYSFGYVYNMNIICPNIHLGFKLINRADGSVKYKSIPESGIINGIGYCKSRWTTPGTCGSTMLTDDVTYGNYDIYPAWYDEEEVWYPLSALNYYANSYNVIIDENGWTISKSEGKVDLEDFKAPDTIIYNGPYTVTISASNSSEFDATTTYRVLLNVNGSFYSANEILNVNVPAGQSVTLDYNVSFNWPNSLELPCAGEIYLTDPNLIIVADAISVTIVEPELPEEPEHPSLELSSLYFHNTTNNLVDLSWNVESGVTIDVSNISDFAGTARYRFQLHVCDYTPGSTLQSVSSKIVAYSPWYDLYLEEEETKKLTTTFVINESDLTELPESGFYYLVMVDYNKVETRFDWLSGWGYSKVAYINMPVEPEPVITLSKTSLSLYPGDTYEFGINITPDDTPDLAFSIYTSDENVVTVEGATLTAVGIGEATITVACGEATATCKVKVKDPNDAEEVILGDVDGNADVTVSDAVALVDYILGLEYGDFVVEAADVNGDNNITVADVVCIVDIVLGVSKYSMGATSALYTESYLTMDGVALQSNVAVSVPLSLSSDRDFTAMQFDVELPEGAQITNAEGAALCNGHAVAWNKLDQNHYRVLVYALNNNAFRSQEGEVVNLGIMADNADVAGDIVISNGMGVTANGLTFSLPECRAAAGTSGLSLKAADGLQMRLEGRTLHVNAPAEMALTISSVGGVSTCLSLKAGENIYTFSAPGLYIVGNRKVIVK